MADEVFWRKFLIESEPRRGFLDCAHQVLRERYLMYDGNFTSAARHKPHRYIAQSAGLRKLPSSIRALQIYLLYMLRT